MLCSIYTGLSNVYKKETVVWGYCRFVIYDSVCHNLISTLLNIIIMYNNCFQFDSFGIVGESIHWISKKSVKNMHKKNTSTAFGINKILCNNVNNLNKKIEWILNYSVENIIIGSPKTRSIYFGVCNHTQFMNSDPELVPYYKVNKIGYCFVGFKLTFLPIQDDFDMSTFNVNYHLIPYYNLHVGNSNSNKSNYYFDMNYIKQIFIGGKTRQNNNIHKISKINNKLNLCGCIHFTIEIKYGQINLFAKVKRQNNNNNNKELISYAYMFNWYCKKKNKFIVQMTEKSHVYVAVSLSPQCKMSMKSNFDNKLNYYVD